MAIIEKPYKLSEIYRHPKEWYVYYFYKHPDTGQFVRFKESYSLNKKANIPHRETIAKEICKVVDAELKAGWSPFDLPIDSRNGALTHIQQIVNDWQRTESASASHTYRQMLSRLRKFLTHTEKSLIQVDEFNIDIANDFQRYLMEILKLAPKTVNTTLSHVGLFWDELIVRKLTKTNPLRLVTHVQKKDYRGIDINFDSEEHDFIPLTSEELQIVFQCFARYYRHLLRFFGLIYWGFLRPVEITRIRIKDIDLASGLIRIGKADAKNKTGAYIQILKPMRILLEEMKLHLYPPDWFVFTGKDLMPGIKQKDPEKATDSWNLVVHIKLKILKKPYALKHTGNIHYILNNKGNVDREWMQRQNRHKTRTQTDKYIERLNIYTIDEDQYNFIQIPDLSN